MLPKLHLLRIAFKFFKRDFKRGELAILLWSVIIAMASVSSIYLLVNRIEMATESEVADVLGADLVITSPRPIDTEWIERADALGLAQASSVEFASVLFANDKLQLSQVKAISNNFPLKGQLEIADQAYAKGRAINQPPPQGEIWLQPRLFNQLALNIGDSIEVGYAKFTVAAILNRQPEQGTTLFNIAPTAIIHVDDLAATKIIQPGSRVVYRYLFAGKKTALTEFLTFVEKRKLSSQRISSVYEESPMAGSALKNSKKYLGLASLLTLILLGIAIAIAINRYTQKQFDACALMRCFGLTGQQVLKIFSYVLCMVCVIGIIAGSLIGLVFQQLLLAIVAEFYNQQLPAAQLNSLLLPILVTLSLFFGFSLPAFLRLKSISPMMILRRQWQALPASAWLVYLFSAVILVFVMWLQVKDFTLLLSVVAGLLLAIVLFALIGLGLLKLLKQLSGKQHAAVNFSLRQLDANRATTLLHLLAFSISLFVMLLIILIRTELLDKWQQSLGEDVPNHFLVNLKTTEIQSLEEFFTQQQINFAGLYPMVRARLHGKNGEDIRRAIPESARNHNTLRRELNLSWTADLPESNQIVEGQWWWQDQSDDAKISVEEKTAKQLGLDIGDQLNFKIGADDWSARIVNIRSIDWQTFTPNFYFIANPGELDAFNPTYITSFYLPADKKHLLVDLTKNYPGSTIIDIEKILLEIQNIINKVSQAIELIMLFLLAAGIMLVRASIDYSMHRKLKQSAILRTLGASRQFISHCFRFEYLCVALLASLITLVAIETVAYLLYTQVFDISFQFHWWLWAVLPVFTMLLMLAVSWRAAKKIAMVEPLTLMRQ